MPRRSKIRAVDLPRVRDECRILAGRYLARAEDGPERPDLVREMQRMISRRDLALWWVSRPMSILAAHEAQTIPQWDARGGLVRHPTKST